MILLSWSRCNSGNCSGRFTHSCSLRIIALPSGARRALIPIDNKRSFFDVSAEVLEAIDPIFYGDMRQATFKALGLN